MPRSSHSFSSSKPVSRAKSEDSNSSPVVRRRPRRRFRRLRWWSRRIFRPWSGHWRRHSIWPKHAGIAGEAAFFAALFLAGVFGLTLVLLIQFAPSEVAKLSGDRMPSAFSTSLSTWVFGVLSLSAIGTGAGSLIYRLVRVGASNEFRNALANRAGAIEKEAIDLIGPKSIVPAADDLSKLPHVPRGTSLTDSPGERLAYRLAAEASESGIAGPASLALLWNAVWFILLAIAVSGLWNGTPRYILTGLLAPFAAIGYWAFKYFLTQLKRTAGVGPTIVEISHQPLCPGDGFELFVLQMGKLQLKKLQIELTCEEETFYRQGTDVRVDRHQSFVKVLCKERAVRVDPQASWEQQFTLTLPLDVMHSFVGTHNAIRWKITVKGDSNPWPSFYRSFPIVVHPPVALPKRSPR